MWGGVHEIFLSAPPQDLKWNSPTKQAYIPIEKIMRTSKQSASTSWQCNTSGNRHPQWATREWFLAGEVAPSDGLPPNYFNIESMGRNWRETKLLPSLTPYPLSHLVLATPPYVNDAQKTSSWPAVQPATYGDLCLKRPFSTLWLLIWRCYT